MAEGVRFRDDEFEAKCDYCLEWWPLDLDYWLPSHGFRKCHACIRDQKTAYMARRRQDPEVRARDRAVSTANRAAKTAADPDHAKRVQHEWYVRNAERKRAKRRARYAEQKAARGETVRHYGPPKDRIVAIYGGRKFTQDQIESRRKAAREHQRRKRAEARAA